MENIIEKLENMIALTEQELAQNPDDPKFSKSGI